ncbi:MAG: hypothetical protein KAV18_03420 [Candidatus Omnitrophica bacterium]|nr:hypothetical protein [Candidatus Omnitrophota bacterium]MCK4423097.1 hypothetical protein [Candidatus Omnitrophota bacterium]
MAPKKPYTVIIRKSELEYVGLCLELNVSARGVDLPEVETNLKNAIDDYLEYAMETRLSPNPVPIDELVEFLRDTSPKGQYTGTKARKCIYQPLELNEVPLYV